MSTWPNRGASGGPCGGLEERKTEANAVRPTRSDSSQQASSKPGAVHTEDGPAVVDGRKALQTGSANHALKWVLPEAEAELRPIFAKAVKVRALGADAAEFIERIWART